jgi:hypothetical protein
VSARALTAALATEVGTEIGSETKTDIELTIVAMTAIWTDTGGEITDGACLKSVTAASPLISRLAVFLAHEDVRTVGRRSTDQCSAAETIAIKRNNTTLNVSQALAIRSEP